MKPKTLTVVAIIKAKPGREAALQRELAKLVAPTLKETGCINYDLHQDTENPTRFIFHENWTSKPHLDAHLASPHLQAFDTRANDLLAEPPEIILAERVE